MGLADTRTGVVFAGAALVAAVALPLAVWRWMTLHSAFFGEITVGPSGHARALDAKWVYPLLGVLALVSYSALAGFALVAARRASRRARNLITVAMLPVFFGLVWLWIGGSP
jgi:hypothetical protein